MAHSTIPSGLRAKLWKHQKDAIEFAYPYLRDPTVKRTGLIRMPTGTGKTGVIAVLSVAMPPFRWSLILTPWTNLCDQMAGEIEKEFWEKRDWKPKALPTVTRLYPSNLDELLDEKTSQMIVIATFATLVTIFKRNRKKYEEFATRLSEVFVDEGHYEPAYEWGQAVKQLKKPTVLLTATPYRNDLKLFRVSKDDVQHYTHEAAEADGIIRQVSFKSLGVAEPSDKQLTPWCDAFAKYWQGAEKKALHKDPRAIICCAKMATVERVTELLRDRGINALGIHDRFGGSGKDWLKQYTPDPAKVDYDVWVHQNKLTEGLDDHRFCVLAVLNRIRSDRKLIQQIGRVLRRSREKVGRAVVLYSEGLPVERSWKNYRSFETQPDFVQHERYRRILDTLLQQQPEMEYFSGRFRSRFESSDENLLAQVLLRASAAVRRVNSSFSWEEFTECTSDFLLLEDRILLGPGKEYLKGPEESRLWVYAVFGNSPLLIEHSQYEIRLGAMAAVKHDNLLFLVDTEGVYPTDYLTKHTKKLSSAELGRVFGKKTIPKEVSLTNPWPAGPTVRRSTIYADDLAGTPAQLTDAVFMCAGVRATVPSEVDGMRPRRQYVGFQRGRISEQIRSVEREAFSLKEYVEWTKGLAELLQSQQRKPPEFFQRYLCPVAPPAVVTPEYLVINLFEGDVELQDELEHRLELCESVVKVDRGTPGDNGTLRFPCRLRFRHLDEDEGDTETVSATLSYEPGAARFRFQGEELNTRVMVVDSDSHDAHGLVTFLNNNDEAFTVALAGPGLYYTSQAFFQVDYTHAEIRLGALLTSIDTLAKADSEKGDKTPRKTKWDGSSVFGIIADWGSTGLVAQEFGQAELLLCDDLDKEVADFIAVDFKRRKIAFIHAKHGKGHIVSASALHEVVAQALKNLGVLSSRGTAKPANLHRWERAAMWSTTRIPRWQRGAASLPQRSELWKKIRSDILDHPRGAKEVWLVVGQTLEKKELLDQLRDPKKRDAVTGQIVHLLSFLNGACEQLKVRLRIFCH